MFKKISLMLMFIIGILLITSCSNSKKDEKANKDVKEQKVLKVVAAYGGKEKIFQKFTEETGIKVEFIDMSSGEVLSRIKAENGSPMADVWFGGGTDSFIAAKNAGLLEAYKSKEAEKIPDKYKDADGYWTGISIVTVGFMVNKDVLKEKNLPMPKKWEDLTNEKYKGEVMMADPSISGTNYAMVNGLIQALGEEKAWDYFDRLNKNIPFFAKRGSEPGNKVSTGEFAIAIVPMSLEAFTLEKKFPVETIYPEDMIPWVPAPVAIFKNAKNIDSAKLFVDWALSQKGQQFMHEQDPRIMVRDDINLSKDMKAVPMDKLIKMDISLVGSKREEILKTWVEKFGSKSVKK